MKGEANIKTLEEAVNFAYSYKLIPFVPMKEDFAPFTIMPAGVKEEMLRLLEILAKHNPRTLLEIGTSRGGSLFLFSRVASSDATLISVDLPWGRFGGGYPNWKIPLYKRFARERQKIYLIRANSHDPTTLEQVRNIVDKALDFLFIDGDHSYEGVRKDFEMYSPLVRKGGIIAFHDILPHPPESGCEVSKFWNEIKKNYRYLEIFTIRIKTGLE